LSVWPDALVLDYGLPRRLTLRDVLPGALIIVALLVATLVALARSRAVGFLAASFFLTLAPTSSIIAVTSEVGAERRMYLPFAALATLAVIGGRALIDRAGARTVRLPPPRFALWRVSPKRSEGRESDITYITRTKARVIAAASLTAVVLVACAARTIARNAEYADPLTLWRTVVDRRPHGRARMALATELMTAGQHEQVIPVLRDAVTDFPDARAALGTALILDRQYDEGIAVLRRFVADGRSRPDRIPAHVMLAEALTSQHKLEEAAGEWRAILAMAPADPGARSNLSRLLSAQADTALRQNDVSGAEQRAREAVQLAPRDGVAHNLLGVALASKGNLSEALAHFQEARQLEPDDPQIRANLERAVRAQRNAQ
jgi:Flp pilus assembly protein TadD